MRMLERDLFSETVMKIIFMYLRYAYFQQLIGVSNFVLKVTSIIIFLGSVINVLYYLGVMQYIIGKIAWLMQKCLDTTAAEVDFE
jgi:nucleoside permease NupC